jgi:cytidyltransferase-like protein
VGEEKLIVCPIYYLNLSFLINTLDLSCTMAMGNNGLPLALRNNQLKRPLRIGVFGGSFNPIHLGHSLLAITTQQTKNVDQVVLVPVYKHAVKRDLLPFEDRFEMCKLAVQSFGDALHVSTIERDVGESNGDGWNAPKASRR